MTNFTKLRDRAVAMSQGANVRCADFCHLLDDMGFVVRSTSSGGHKVVKHKGLTDFFWNFNCGHSGHVNVKPNYIRNFVKLIEKHEEELEKWLQ